VARVAAEHGVTGLVGNDQSTVFIEAQGTPAQTDQFIAAVLGGLPPLAHVASTSAAAAKVVAEEDAFRIVPSRHTPGARTLIPPDVAPCADCLREMHDPADRRHRYPFITCTNCGPRLSIIRDLPYDRPATTMAAFPMCPACAAEYRDPADRRYHAQPISCFDCGPRLWLADANGTELATWEDGIGQAREILAAGGTVAVKGIGGFTLFCDARQAPAVARLRERKRRPGKPFAVMAASAASAARFADLSAAQLRELASPQRPIILAPMSAGYDLATGVAPGLGDVGVMLPSAPLHHLLVQGEEVYVATSGNLAGEPLRYQNEAAVADLGAIADAFLTHDRPIHVPVEDSVLLADGATILPIRRSRGYAPLPIALECWTAPANGAGAGAESSGLPSPTGIELNGGDSAEGGGGGAVLAVGGELKNTFAVTRDAMAFLSAHIGDMESPAAQLAFARSVRQLIAMHGRDVELVVADLHPDYATTTWAERYCADRDLPLIQVQHHHAHALSLLAEHRISPDTRAVVAAFDGAGYGLDGAIWGSEVLALGGTADPLAFERIWHLDEYWLPGGDSAQAAPWKCAVALMDQLGLDGSGLDGSPLPPLAAASAQEVALLRQLPVAAASGLPGLIHRTTSAGRLFDAVASILGVRQRVTYEAQAAMELERLARNCVHAECAAWRPSGDPNGGPNGALAVLLGAVIGGTRRGQERACLARRFHSGLAAIIAAALVSAAEREDAEVLGLTGGVFQNRLLTGATLAAVAALTASGSKSRPVLTHRLAPAGDGGLALGQARAGHCLLTWAQS
jgi:hydrogenase maturation protein HypF